MIKKAKTFAYLLPEPVEGGSFINVPFDTLRYSGSGASNIIYESKMVD